MISIITDTGRLDLNQDTRIRFVMVNPLYSGEIGYASQSFSFAIPDSPGNRVKLGLRDITHIEDFDELVDVTLEIGGMPWQEAKLQVSTVPHSGDWSGVLYLNESRLALALNDKMMQEFELGGVREISTETDAFDIADDMIDHANLAAAGTMDTFDYTFFPIKNTYTFYDGKNQDESVALQTLYMNWWMDDSFWCRLGTSTRGGSPIDAVCNLIPQPYLLSVLNMMLQEVGYNINPSAFSTDAEIKTLTIYNQYAIDKLKLFGAPIASVFGYHNWFMPTINLQNHLPELTGKEFLIQVLRAFGLVVDVGSSGVSFLSRNEILADTEERDWRAYAISYQFERGEIVSQKYVDSLDDADELMGGDYLRDPNDFIIVGEVDYYADLPLTPAINSEDIYYVVNDNSYYELVVTDEAAQTREWVRYTGRYDEIIIGEEEDVTELVSGISTTMIFDGPWHSGFSIRVPWVQQMGSSPAYGLNRNPFSFRLLFYRGLVTDEVAAGAYPQAMPDDQLGTYNYSLYPHGERGRYNTWWKQWAEYRQNARPVTYQLNLPFSEFFRLNPFKRVRVRTKDAEVSGYWKQISFDIGINGIENTEMTMEARK